MKTRKLKISAPSLSFRIASSTIGLKLSKRRKPLHRLPAFRPFRSSGGYSLAERNTTERSESGPSQRRRRSAFRPSTVTLARSMASALQRLSWARGWALRSGWASVPVSIPASVPVSVPVSIPACIEWAPVSAPANIPSAPAWVPASAPVHIPVPVPV